MRYLDALVGRMEQGRISTSVEDDAAGHAHDLPGDQILLTAKALQESGGSYLRAAGQYSRLQIDLLEKLPVKRLVDGLVIQLDLLTRTEKPFFNLAVQNAIAEEHQETDWHEAQRQRAEVQFRLDAGTLAVMPPLNNQLDA